LPVEPEKRITPSAAAGQVGFSLGSLGTLAFLPVAGAAELAEELEDAVGSAATVSAAFLDLRGFLPAGAVAAEVVVAVAVAVVTDAS
jgi:hypothetical protein